MPVCYSPPTTPRGRADPEDGPKARRVWQCVAEGSRIAVLGFACDAGVGRNKGRIGAVEGPTAIRQALYAFAAPSLFEGLTDLGDVEVTGDDLEQGQQTLARHIRAGLAAHERVIVLGGGHETAVGSYLGVRSAFPTATIGIINLDAHLDLRNVGASGPSSGTPFNQIRNIDPSSFEYLCIGVARESNTQALIERAEDWNAGIVYDQELIRNPSAAFALIKALIRRIDCLYLTIDIDVLPHYQAPGVSAPATRGVPLTTIQRIVQFIISTCDRQQTPIRVTDIVEVSPPHDANDVTAKSAALLAMDLLHSNSK